MERDGKREEGEFVGRRFKYYDQLIMIAAFD